MTLHESLRAKIRSWRKDERKSEEEQKKDINYHFKHFIKMVDDLLRTATNKLGIKSRREATDWGWKQKAFDLKNPNQPLIKHNIGTPGSTPKTQRSSQDNTPTQTRYAGLKPDARRTLKYGEDPPIASERSSKSYCIQSIKPVPNEGSHSSRDMFDSSYQEESPTKFDTQRQNVERPLGTKFQQTGTTPKLSISTIQSHDSTSDEANFFDHTPEVYDESERGKLWQRRATKSQGKVYDERQGNKRGLAEKTPVKTTTSPTGDKQLTPSSLKSTNTKDSESDIEW